jgi:hypothetical protein
MWPACNTGGFSTLAHAKLDRGRIAATKARLKLEHLLILSPKRLP